MFTTSHIELLVGSNSHSHTTLKTERTDRSEAWTVIGIPRKCPRRSAPFGTSTFKPHSENERHTTEAQGGSVLGRCQEPVVRYLSSKTRVIFRYAYVPEHCCIAQPGMFYLEGAEQLGHSSDWLLNKYGHTESMEFEMSILRTNGHFRKSFRNLVGWPCYLWPLWTLHVSCCILTNWFS